MAVPTYQVLLISNNGLITKDVTAYVRSVGISRGRSRELDRFEAGSFSIVFDNRSRYFDPLYTSSPYNGYITPKRSVQIWSAGIKQFDGNIQDWNLSYDISGDSIAIANGADQFAYLAQQSLTGGLQTSQLSGARLDAVVADPNITWPFGGVYTLFDAGRRTLQADTIAAGTNALEYIQLVERTEGGYFYVSSGGDLTFKQSGSANISLINFTDSGVAGAYNIPYQGIDITYGSELLYNQISLTRLSAGTPVFVDKPSSISAYGAAAYSDDGLLYVNDTDTRNQALLLAAKYATPEYRFDSVTVSLTSLTASKQANLLILDLTDIVKVIYTPNGVGSAISKYVRVIGIDHTMNVDDHQVTYHFASLENEQLILNDSVFGLLDYNVLGF